MLTPSTHQHSLTNTKEMLAAGLNVKRIAKSTALAQDDIQKLD
jgi:hypothetical protein